MNIKQCRMSELGGNECHGCHLSLFLFFVVMTMLMKDAVALLSPCSQAPQSGTPFDVLYADDTILLGSSPDFVQEYACAVQQADNK